MNQHYGFTKLIVDDLEGLATFYKNVAGLTEFARVQDCVGSRKFDEIVFNETAQGGATLVLFKFLDEASSKVGEVMIGFMTDNLEAFVERVLEAGGGVVAPIETKEAHGLKVAFLSDPEGHVIEVAELLAK